MTAAKAVAVNEFGIGPPYQVEFGAVGLHDVRLGIGINNISKPIQINELKLRRVLNDANAAAVDRLIEEFMAELYDLAVVKRTPGITVPNAMNSAGEGSGRRSRQRGSSV
jgi:hypothetical protein